MHVVWWEKCNNILRVLNTYKLAFSQQHVLCNNKNETVSENLPLSSHMDIKNLNGIIRKKIVTCSIVVVRHVAYSSIVIISVVIPGKNIYFYSCLHMNNSALPQPDLLGCCREKVNFLTERCICLFSFTNHFSLQSAK